MASNLLPFNPAKAQFLPIGLPEQLSEKILPVLLGASYTIRYVATVRNFGVTFDSNICSSDHISALSK
jgi:hypothetical protein